MAKTWALCNETLICKCGHQWHPRRPALPKVCPTCKRRDWFSTENKDYLVLQSSCWIWLGPKTGMYGRIKSDGKMIPVHRYYFEKYKGKIPSGLVIDHTCKNHLCVNPNHLETCTREENTARGGFLRKCKRNNH